MKHSCLTLSVLTIALVAGPLVAQDSTFREQSENARIQVLALRNTLGLDQDHDFLVRRAHVDHLGQVHTRMQQAYKGVPIWGGELIAHTDAEGTQLPATLDIRKGVHLNVAPTLGSPEALAVAHRDLNPKGSYAYQPTCELVVYPEMRDVLQRNPHALDEVPSAMDVARQVLRYNLAYHVHAQLENGKEETVHMDYMIDAHTGAILKKWSTLHTTAVTGTGMSQWYGTVSLNTNYTGSTYEMRDMVRGTGGTFGNNVTTNLNHATSGNGTIYTDADNAWGDGNGYGSGTTTSTTGATGQTAAVDQHHGMAMTWDMYKNVFGRNGIDNAGKAAYGRMHYSSNYDNAFWDDTCFCMTYGDGAPPSGSYGEADLDTVGHEMSHGVCATTANLTYSGESGGLNESNSDIFGTCVEFYTLGAGGTGSVIPDSPGTGTVTANYTMFENSWGHPGQALRYMYRPDLDGTSPNFWYSSLGSLDVHYSSGPMNRCWYFLAKGATTSGDTSTAINTTGSTGVSNPNFLPSGMSGIGNDKAAKIWYRALSVYLTSSSNYAAARTAAISAAKDLYGAGGAEEQAVWNAFHGINVGAAWASTGVTVAISPATANIQTSATFQFTASVTGSTNTAVTWTATGGTVSTSGLYTAPATAGTYTVKATSAADTTKSASATVTVTPVGAVSITITPTTATVPVSTTYQFSAAVTGSTNTAVTWTATGGTVSTTGLYTAPATAGTYTVKATSQADTTKSASATVTVTTTGTTYNEVESNGTLATANAVPDTATKIVGYIGTTTDLDYFKVLVGAGKTLTVNMTGPSGKDYDLYLYNSAGTQLKSSIGTTATESVTYTNTGSAAVYYYIKVLGYNKAYSTTTPYNLALTR